MTTYIAVVLGPEGVRAVSAADSEHRLLEKLADYVRENAEMLLWPADARTVLSRLAAGQFREAIQHYFMTVGGRWDREVLETFAVTPDERWAAPADPERPPPVRWTPSA